MVSKTTGFFAGLGAVATIIGLWEFTFKDRILPHHVADIELCPINEVGEITNDLADESFRSLAEFLVLNISRTVYLDINFVDVCERDSDLALSLKSDTLVIKDTDAFFSFESFVDRNFIDVVFVKVAKSEFRNSALSRVQQGLGDMSGDRILGAFFVRGNLDAGLFNLSLADVGYSRELETMHHCTREVANSETFLRRSWAFLSSCVVGLSTERYIDRF